MRQRVDLHVALEITGRLRARQCIAASDVHRAGTADTTPAGSAKGQCFILTPLYLVQTVKNRPGFGWIQPVVAEIRLLVLFRIISEYGEQILRHCYLPLSTVFSFPGEWESLFVPLKMTGL